MTESQFATRDLEITINKNLRIFAPFYSVNFNYKVMQRLLTGEENKQKVDFPRLPITISKLEQVRLGRLGEEGDRKELRKTTYVHTATLILPDPNSDAVMTVPEHPLIYLLSGYIQLENRQKLPITEDMYEASRELEGSFEFTAEQANGLRNNLYSQPKIRRQAWESWNKGDTELTDAYVADVEKSRGYKFDESAMGIWLSNNKGGRLLRVDRVDIMNGSNAVGDSDMHDNYCHLFGEVAEPQDVARKIEKAKNWVRQFKGLEERL